MPDFEEKKEKYLVIKNKIDSMVMALRDISDDDIRKFSVKNLHDVDKYMFEILKIIERY